MKGLWGKANLHAPKQHSLDSDATLLRSTRACQQSVASVSQVNPTGHCESLRPSSPYILHPTRHRSLATARPYPTYAPYSRRIPYSPYSVGDEARVEEERPYFK